MGTRRLTSRAFFDLLRTRTRRTAAAVDARIEAAGLTELTVLAADSSGFTRKTHRYGILQFLALMTRAYDRLIPIIERHGGTCLTNNADNILAVFDRPQQGVRAAVAMQRAMRSANRRRPEAERFEICIGVHHGPLIRLSDDVFGATVNVTAKIGEDLAGANEILITKPVRDALPARVEAAYDRTAEIGGERIELFRVR